MAITYEQARADHEYLWGIGPADDMTGAYVDQEDLGRMLKSPTKATARDCYVNQIQYWFQAGPDESFGLSRARSNRIPWDDPTVQEIAERHGIDIPDAV